MNPQLIPESLLNSAKNGGVSIFLGAGASIGSLRKDGSKVPNGAGLAAEWKDRYLPLETNIGSDLQWISSILADKGILPNALNDSLTVSTPCEALKIIPTIQWRSIFTTNPDDGLEVAYSELGDDSKCQDLVPIVARADDGATDTRIQVDYYKLHGCIRHPAEGFVFSISEYLSARAKKYRGFVEFSRALENGPLVFIGYSLRDEEIKNIVNAIPNETSSRKHKLYLVAPIESEAIANVYKNTYGVEVISATAEEFLKCLRALLKDRVTTISQTIGSSISGFQLQLPLTESSPRLRFNLSKNFELPQAQVKAASNLPEDAAFLYGRTPLWKDIAQNNDVERAETSAILSAIDEWLKSETPTFNIRLLLGKTASGKSTILKRAAYKTETEFNLLVLFLSRLGTLVPEEIITVVESSSKAVVLFVDDAADHIFALREIANANRRKQVPLFICAAERTHRYNTAPALMDTALQIVPLPDISESEAQDFVNHLELKVSPKKFAGLKNEEKLKLYLEEAAQDLLVANLEIITGSFDEFLMNESREIKTAAALNAYKIVAMCDQNKLRIPQYSLIKCLNVSDSSLKSQLFDPLEGIIQVIEDTNSEDWLITGRHPVVSEVIASKLMNNGERYDLLKSLLPHLSLHRRGDRYLVEKLTHHDIVFDLFPEKEVGNQWYREMKEFAVNRDEVDHQWALYQNKIGDHESARSLIVSIVSREPTPQRLLSKAIIEVDLSRETKEETRAMFLLRSGNDTFFHLLKERPTAALFHAAITRYNNWIRRKADSEFTFEVADYCQKFVDLAVKSQRTNPTLISAIGEFYASLGKADKIEHYITAGLKRMPSNHRLRVLQCSIYLERGEDALKVFNTLIEGLAFGSPTISLLQMILKTGFVAGKKFGEMANIYERIFATSGNTQDVNLMFAHAYTEPDMAGVTRATELIKSVPPFSRSRISAVKMGFDFTKGLRFEGKVIKKFWDRFMIEPIGNLPKNPPIKSDIYMRSPDWAEPGQAVTFQLDFSGAEPIAKDIKPSLRT